MTRTIATLDHTDSCEWVKGTEDLLPGEELRLTLGLNDDTIVVGCTRWSYDGSIEYMVFGRKVQTYKTLKGMRKGLLRKYYTNI